MTGGGASLSLHRKLNATGMSTDGYMTNLGASGRWDRIGMIQERMRMRLFGE